MKSQTRQLAAIMFTDIVGYTAMMGRDEHRAFQLLETNRQVHLPIIAEFNGQLIKELGDGILATFNTVSEAVDAAQRILKASLENEYALHIGVHTAEVVFENGDVFGDGVNIAARLQALAPSGGIYVSGSVNNNLSNRNEFHTRFVRTEYLKNVKDPIQIYEVVQELTSGPHDTPEGAGTGSLVKGFNSDVYISYRPNDNKVPAGVRAEGWVTEFVNNLRMELEATVKGKVTIYFDQNPREALMATGQMDESLNARLNTLIFIPIISQTYCDPEAYAWKCEFLEFVRRAEAEPLGLAVKLPNGNVSSRVIPIRIHELDPADVKSIEDELKTRFRPIDLVFKAPGVNRPLQAREDDPLKNLNKTIYRDQVNKLANVIKEIIYSQKNQESRESAPSKPNPPATALEFPGIGRTALAIPSMTVRPFTVAGQPESAFLGEGLSEGITAALSPVRSFKLTHPGAASLSLEGSLAIQSNDAVVHARLIEKSGNRVMWEKEYRSTRRDLFNLHPQIITDLAQNLGITLKPAEKKIATRLVGSMPEAQESYWLGRHYWRKRGNDLIKSLECFGRAAKLDPVFAEAHSGMAMAYVLMGYYNLVPFEDAVRKAKEAAFRALELDASLLEAYFSLAFASLCYEWNWPEAQPNFIKVLAINAQHSSAINRYKLCRDQIRNTFEESEAEPIGGIPYSLHAYALLHQGKLEEALTSAKQAVERDPGSFMAQRALGLSYLGLGHEKDALATLQEATQLSNRHPWLLFDLMGAHATVAGNEEAQSIMEEALASAHALSARINDFFFKTS
jgi:class 3 adenylate cyclase/TolB-like protein